MTHFRKTSELFHGYGYEKFNCQKASAFSVIKYITCECVVGDEKLFKFGVDGSAIFEPDNVKGFRFYLLMVFLEKKGFFKLLWNSHAQEEEVRRDRNCPLSHLFLLLIALLKLFSHLGHIICFLYHRSIAVACYNNLLNTNYATQLSFIFFNFIKLKDSLALGFSICRLNHHPI